MKRHEYRDFNFWKKLDETDFAIISTVNNQALSVLINKMRGDRTLEKYAYECDVAISTLYRCINGERKRPYHYDILLALYQGKSPECEIGFEYLLAANGMMLVEDIAKQQDKLLKKAGIKTTKGEDKKRERLEKDQKKACRKLGALIKEMKGNRSYAEYAFDCLLPKGTIIYIVNLGRKTPLTEAQLRLLYEHRYPGCSVTLKQLQKANAMFPKDKRIKEPDVPVLYSMSENCRGVKRRVHFEEDAGIMKGFFTKIKHGKRIGYFGVDEIEKIVDHKDAKSNITKEAMFAANGMMPMEPLRRMHFLLLPEKKDVQDLRKKEHAEPQFVHCDYYPDDNERFLDDLSFFARELSDKELFHIKKYLDDIFQNKAIVKMLYKYRKNHEKLLNLCKDMEKEVDMSILHEQKGLIAGYKEMILSLIWEEFPASEDKQVEVIPVAEETPVFQESDEFEFSRFPSGIASLKKK